MNADSTPVRPHNAEYDGHPEPPARELRCKERLEKAGNIPLGYAAAFIGDFHINVFACIEVLAVVQFTQRSRCQVLPARGNSNHTAAHVHRLGRIDDKIHDDLAQLGLIRFDYIGSLTFVVFDRQRLRYGRPNQISEIVEKSVEIDRSLRELPLPRIGEHLVAQFREFSARILDSSQIFLDQCVIARPLLDQIQITQYRRQKVVEVMSHTSRKHSQALQFLRAKELRLDAFVFFRQQSFIGHIGKHQQHAVHLTVIVINDSLRYGGPDYPAIRPRKGCFDGIICQCAQP